LAIGTEGGAVRIVDIVSGAIAMNITGRASAPVQMIEFDNDEKTLFVTTSTGAVGLYAVDTGENLQFPPELARLAPSIALVRPKGASAFFGNNNGEVLIFGFARNGNSISVTDIILNGPLFKGRVTAAATTREGNILAAGSADRTVAAVRWNDGKSLEGPQQLDGAVKSVDAAEREQEGPVISALSTTGRLAVTNLDRSLPIEISFLQKGKFAVATIAPTADSILTVTNDNTAQLTCLIGEKRTSELRGHDAEIIAARFDPEMQFAVTGSRDGVVRVWYLRRPGAHACVELDSVPGLPELSQSPSAADLLARARVAAGRDLSPAEYQNLVGAR
jgi:WD40 repeat protein